MHIKDEAVRLYEDMYYCMPKNISEKERDKTAKKCCAIAIELITDDCNKAGRFDTANVYEKVLSEINKI